MSNEQGALRGAGLRQSWFLRGASHHTTLWLARMLPGAIPLVYVMGYPKSGTTWMSQLVADYMQLPLIKGTILPIGMPAVMHGHQRVRPEFHKCIYGVRDGRDVFVSLYFFLAKRLPPGDHPRMSVRQRRNFPGLVNRDRVLDNFTPFVEQQLKTPFATEADWGAHVRSYLECGRKDVPLMKYEDLLADGPGTLSRAMSTMTGEEADPDKVRWAIEKYSFARQSGRKVGEEDRKSFLRKGGSGDWINHFTREAAEAFEEKCGDGLRAMGYEEDSSWVKRCPTLAEKREAARSNGAT